MSLLAKIGLFVAFLFAFGIWTAAAYWLTMRLVRAMVAQRGYLLLSAAVGVVSFAGMFIFVWLLSGFLDWRFLGLLLASQVLSLLLIGVCWALLGSPGINWGACLYWEAFLVTLRYSWEKWISVGVGVVVLLGFPITLGWVYFTHDVPSSLNTLRVFQVTIAWLYLAGLLEHMRKAVLLLSSPTMAADARDRALVTQLGGFVTLGLMFSMILWAFGVGSYAPIFATSIPVDVSLNVVAALLAFLLLAFVAPYMVGVQRANRLRREFSRGIQALLTEVVEVLKLPRPHAVKVEKMAELRNRIDTRIGEVQATYPQVKLAAALEDPMADWDSVAEPVQLVKAAYPQAGPHDPCLQHRNRLGELAVELEGLETTLAQVPPDAQSVLTLRDAADVFESRLRQMREDGESKDSPKMAIVISAGLSAAASPLMSEMGKLLWSRIKDSSPGAFGALELLADFIG